MDGLTKPNPIIVFGEHGKAWVIEHETGMVSHKRLEEIIHMLEAGLKNTSPLEIELINDQQADSVEQSIKTCHPKKKDKPGYVYLIQSESGWYKIGKTSNPENRIRTFSVKLPFRVEYICLIKSNNMDELEMELHDYFKDQRIDGEWFELSIDDVDYIKSIEGYDDHVQ
jgi:hypothetical protein